MTNHPNRGRKKNPASNPSPDEIAAARHEAKLTQKGAGELIYAAENTWQQYELGERRMHPAFWELFNIKTRRRSSLTGR